MIRLLLTPLLAIIKSVAAGSPNDLSSDIEGVHDSYIQKAILRGLSERLNHRIGFDTPSSTDKLRNKRQEANSGRRLSSPEYVFDSCEDDPKYRPCDAVVGRFTAAELKDLLDSSFSEIFDDPTCVASFPTCGGGGRSDGCKCIHDSMCFFDSFCALEICQDQCYNIVMEPLVASAIQNGVEIRKICSSCDEESKLGNTPIDSKGLGYCTGYGKDATVSGLLVIPTDAASGQNIIPGPLPTHIHSISAVDSTCNGASSIDFTNPANAVFQTSTMMAIMMASLGRVVVIPDTMGVEESYNFFKGFGFKRHYQTSAMPLWLKAKRIILEETASKVSKHVTVSGYSAGGYGAVAIAESLESYGADIIKLLTGGGPYRISSTQIIYSHIKLVEGTLPHYAANLGYMLGQTLSSTIPGAENFRMNQDLLADSWSWNGNAYTKYDIINLTTTNTNRFALYNLVPTAQDKSWLDAWNMDFNEFFSRAIRDGDMEPCKNETRIAEATTAGKPVNKLCEALRANDLDNYMREISYPFEICFSPDDDAVPIDHVLEFSDAIYPSIGDHITGGVFCFMRYVSALGELPIQPGGISEETGEVYIGGSG